jgi:hypothetical protein
MSPVCLAETTCCFFLLFGLAAIGFSEACGIVQTRGNQHLRGRERNLQSGTPYIVKLVLAIDYLNNTSALQIESSKTIPSTNAAIHFCKAVNAQVFSLQ